MESKASGDVRSTPRDKHVKFQQDQANKAAKDKKGKKKTGIIIMLFNDVHFGFNFFHSLLQFLCDQMYSLKSQFVELF